VSEGVKLGAIDGTKLRLGVSDGTPEGKREGLSEGPALERGVAACMPSISNSKLMVSPGSEKLLSRIPVLLMPPKA
jgi:hypothetical protein